MDSQTGYNSDTGPLSETFTPIDYVKITIFGFGLSGLWASLHTVVLQVRLRDFVPEALKNSYLGYLTFTGTVLAMLVQPIVGAASDRSGFSWGRRRPYILVGTIAALVFLPGIGLWESYAAVFLFYCLLQVAANTAQGPYQGLIPDLVPMGKRGRASGVKSLLEILGGVGLMRLAAFFMDRHSSEEGGYWLGLTLGALGLVLLATALVTLLTVRERPGTGGLSLPVLSDLYKSFQINIRQNRPFLWFLVSRGLLGIPGVILQTFILYYLIDVIDIANPAAVAANLVIVVGAGILVVVYFAGRLSDSIGRKPILASSGLIGVVGIVLLFFSHSYPYIMLSGAIIGMANGAILSTGWALATDLAPDGAEAKYLGLTSLAINAGSALARLIGPVIDYFNTLGTNLGYSVMLLACLICFIFGSLLMLKVKQQR